MAIKPTKPTVPPAPSRSNPGVDFSNKADVFAAFQAPFADYMDEIADFVDEMADDALAAATGGDLPPLTGQAGKVLAVKGDESGAEFVPMGQFPAGTAAAPSISNTGDTNTGVFFPAADTVAVATGGSERMRVDSAGNVGVGTVSPTQKLQVSGAIVATGAANSYSADGIYIQNKGGSLFDVAAYRGGGNASSLAFSTNAISEAPTERARITNDGNLLVGTTSDNPVGARVDGTAILSTGRIFNRKSAGWDIGISSSSGAQITWYTDNGSTFVAAGSITSNGSTTAYNTSSDYRLKENVQPMQDALAKIAQLNPVTYTWIADGSDGQGFIAHELQAVVPDCVTGEKDAVDEDGNPKYQGVDTSFLVGILTKAIQEQQALITALTARVAALEA
jgi:hypothetical protein